MMPPHVTRPSHHQPLGFAALVLLSACYTGDFFERLVDSEVVAAFRITRLTLVDPHFYSGDAISCMDSTGMYNKSWNDALDDFDISPTIVISPLDPAIESSTKLQVLPARCIKAGDAVNCSDADTLPADIVEVIFSNSLQGGVCGGPIMGSLNPDYASDKYDPLSSPESPCFLSSLIPKLKLPLGTNFRLPLSNVQISAAYSLEITDDQPEQQLVEGLIVGFLPTDVGSDPNLGSLAGMPFTPWKVIAGAAGCQIAGQPIIDDVDTAIVSHDGVWMYFNFTAERVAWSSTRAVKSTTPDLR